LITGVIISALLLLRRRYVIRKTIRLAKHVYEYGTPATMTLVNRANNYSFKVNGAPQQVITIDIDGHQTGIKTFASRVIDVYTIPQQTVYIHSAYPKMQVPAGIFQLTPQPQRRGLRLGPALFILLPLGFAFGIVYFINFVMSAHSYTHAQPDALLYRQDGKLLLASVFSHFQAHEVSNGTTYGSDNYYAAAIDLQTGKQIWEVDLKANNSEGQNFGAGQLLGQSEKYLFFLRNELYIIDKTNGHVVARNNDLPALRDKLSKASAADYMTDVVYKYSDSLQALVIKGNDGLFYTIDGNTLKTGAIDIADPDSYFRNKFKYGNNYEDQIASLSDDGNRCWALLDTKDTAQLTHDRQGFETRPPPSPSAVFSLPHLPTPTIRTGAVSTPMCISLAASS
jgi:hypothetical protein